MVIKELGGQNQGFPSTFIAEMGWTATGIQDQDENRQNQENNKWISEFKPETLICHPILF